MMHFFWVTLYIVIISNPTGGHLKIMTFVTDIDRYTPPLYIQGDPKKMHHKDSDHKSVLEVRFYFSTCVSESEFRARVT